MQIEQINTNNGYAIIKIDVKEMVNQYDIILHKIDPSEILNIVNHLETTLKDVDLETNKEIIENEIFNIENKINSLIPHRNKRGLFNGIGTIFKWEYGTMDDDDRTNIENYFLITAKNKKIKN